MIHATPTAAAPKVFLELLIQVELEHVKSGELTTPGFLPSISQECI